jgi:hypothetical protein
MAEAWVILAGVTADSFRKAGRVATGSIWNREQRLAATSSDQKFQAHVTVGRLPACVLVITMLLSRDQLPEPMLVGMGLLTAILATVTGVMVALWRVRDQQRGANRGAAAVLATGVAPLLLWLGGSLTVMGFLLIVLVPANSPLRDQLVVAMTGGGGLLIGGAVWGLARSLLFGGSSWLQSVRERSHLPPLPQRLREAWDFQRIVGIRMAGALVMLWAISLGCFLISLALAFAALTWLTPRGPVAAISEGAVNDFVVLLALLFISGGGTMLSLAMLASFRLVARARRVGRVKEHLLWREVGLALETMGLFPTMAWAAINLLAVVFLFGAAVWAGHLTGHGLGLPVAAGPIVGGMLGLLVVWLVVVFPQQYIFTVLGRRDCGWLRAFNASVELVKLEGAEALLKGVLATILFLTVVGIPAAIHLLLGYPEREEILLAAILGERTFRETEEAISLESVHGPDPLRKHFEELEAGRYLDALNGFQIFRFQHPGDVRALEGEARAMLAMGNLKARELLERWIAVDELNPEPRRLLVQWNNGRWGERGDLYLAAQAKCTQPIGRGI